MAYEDGLGGPERKSEAQRWKRAAFDTKTSEATRGEPEAMYWLANAYRQGWGISIDAGLATSWEQKAAARREELAAAGDPEAQYQLANDFAYRSSGKKAGKADKWWTAAVPTIKAHAEQDDAMAQYRLAEMYEFGHGVVKDTTEAKHWYAKAIIGLSKAAESGDIEAMWTLYSIALYGDGGQSANATAKRWHDDVVLRYQAAASRGCVPSQAWFADRFNMKWLFASGQPQEGFRLQSLMWWTIVASSSDGRYRSLIEKAQKEKAAAKLTVFEQELVSSKAARCVQTNFRICE
jgi:TPR repeat protein